MTSAAAKYVLEVTDGLEGTATSYVLRKTGRVHVLEVVEAVAALYVLGVVNVLEVAEVASGLRSGVDGGYIVCVRGCECVGGGRDGVGVESEATSYVLGVVNVLEAE